MASRRGGAEAQKCGRGVRSDGQLARVASTTGGWQLGLAAPLPPEWPQITDASPPFGTTPRFPRPKPLSLPGQRGIGGLAGAAAGGAGPHHLPGQPAAAARAQPGRGPEPAGEAG